MSTYLNESFLKHIDKSYIKTIFEIGAHNGWDTVQLLRFYSPDKIHAFECNPEAINLCQSTYNQFDSSNVIKFNKLAIWINNGTTDFYPVEFSYHKHLNPDADPNKFERNIGMSSCFRESGIYGEKILQNHIIVDCVTLDSYCDSNCVDKIDLLCMDTQGAEFHILSSSPKILNKIKYIILEMNKIEVYSGQKVYDDVKTFLENNGFYMAEFVSQCDSFGDGLFINKNI